MLGTLFILQARPAEILALDTETYQCRLVKSIKEGTPDGIQVDAEQKIVYWTNMGSYPVQGEDFVEADGAIECCRLDGKGHKVLVASGTIVTPKQLQLEKHSQRLYWCDREGMAIYSSDIHGEGLQVLLRTGVWPADTIDVVRHCVGIAIDRSEARLYWTQKGHPDGGEGRIFRMGLALPEGETADTRKDIVLLMDQLPEPIDLEIDEDRRQLYWSDRGDPATQGNSVNRADITKIGLANHKVLATGLKEGIGLALDLERRRIFVSDLSGAIRMLSMDGGEMIVINQCSGPVTGICFVNKRL